jgi:hypothetical protein
LCLLQERFSSLSDLLGEFLLAGQSELGLAGQYLVMQISERVVSDGFVLLRAKDQSQGWVLIGQRPVLAGVVQIEIHPSGIGMREFSDLQIDNDQTAQASMKEQQVDAIPLVADALRYEFKVSLVEKTGLRGCHKLNAILFGKTVVGTITVVFAAEIEAVRRPSIIEGEGNEVRLVESLVLKPWKVWKHRNCQSIVHESESTCPLSRRSTSAARNSGL